MAYRVFVCLVLFTYVACGNDGNKGRMDAPSGSDSGGTIDAPGMTADAAIGALCGGQPCQAAQECCLGSGGSNTCVALNTCGTIGFQCDGPEDCGGTQVCCYGAMMGSGSSGGSTCKNASQCPTNACHVDTDCTQQGATKCCSLPSTPYSVCLAQCPP